MKICKQLFGLIFFILLVVPFFKTDCFASGTVHDVNGDGELIVVIDPGHGGENLGADYGGFIEKDMNTVVANAMYEELSKYDGITVYMTRFEDVEKDISLKNRAKYAQSVNADYLFCLHFNMSANNNFWGTEVWIQSQGQENRNGYAFGNVHMENMADMGLFIRGVKTRLNDKGTDYYGILRHCKEFGITAVLIEHCHVDIDKDVPFCDEQEDLVEFGRVDAISVAEYFGLTSSDSLYDYSGYQLPVEIDDATEYMMHDITDPEICELSVVNCDYENYKVTLSLRATDPDTPMLYYSYSLDGGETFSECFAWPEADMMAGYSPETFEFTVDIEPGTLPFIAAKAYNKYDRSLQSNVLSDFNEFPKIEMPESTEEVKTEVKPVVNSAEELKPAEDGREGNLIYVLSIALIIVLILLLLSMIMMMIKGRKSNKKR